MPYSTRIPAAALGGCGGSGTLSSPFPASVADERDEDARP